jgi:hypothetical protein
MEIRFLEAGERPDQTNETIDRNSEMGTRQRAKSVLVSERCASSRHGTATAEPLLEYMWKLLLFTVNFFTIDFFTIDFFTVDTRETASQRLFSCVFLRR